MAGRPSRVRRILRGVAWAIGALLILALVALAVVLRQLDGEVRSALLDRTRELEVTIGRPITVGAVHVTLASTGEIVVHDVAVEAAPGQSGALAEPLVRVSAVRLGIALGPLLRSRGRAIDLRSLAIEGLELTLVRTPEGLSTDDVRARLEALPATPRPVGGPQVALESLAILGAKLHLRAVGGAPGGPLDVDPFTVRGVDLRPDAPFHLAVEAALAPATTATVGIDFVPAPGGLLAVQQIALHLAGLRLAPLLAWMPSESSAAPLPDLSSAEISADLTVDPQGGTLAARSFDLTLGGVTVHGSLGAHGLATAPVADNFALDLTGDARAVVELLPVEKRPAHVAIDGPLTVSLHGGGSADEVHTTVKVDLHELRVLDVDHAGAQVSGPPLVVGFDGALAYTPKGGAVHVSDAVIHLGALVLRGDAAAHGLDAAPVIDSLTVAASGPIEELLDLAPRARRPPGVTLRGPFTASIAAHGDPTTPEGKLTLDLGGASVHTPTFAKPAGVPLALELEGHVGEPVDLTRVALHLGSLALGARGKVWSAERLDLAFDGQSAAILPFLALFPDAKSRVGEGLTLDGAFAASGTIHVASGKTALVVDASLRDARIRRGLVSVLGAPRLYLHVEEDKGVVSAEVSADLTATTLVVAPAFTKLAGQGALLGFAVTRDGENVHVHDAHLTLPGAALDGIDLTLDPAHFRLAIATTSLALGPLGGVVTLLPSVVPPKLQSATAHFGLELSGDPADPGAAALHVTALELVSGLGHVKGSVDVDGVGHPSAVRFAVTGGELDLDGKGGRDDAVDLPTDDLGHVSFAGHVHLDSVRAGGEIVRAIDGDLSFEHGRLAVPRLHLEALGGALDVEKSWVDLADVPELDVHAKIDKLDLSRVPGVPIAELRGRASGQVDLHGEGVGAAAIQRSLRGTARFTLRDTHGKPVIQPKFTVVNPGLAELAQLYARIHPEPDFALDASEVSAGFTVGANRLTITDPILVRTEDFVAHLKGTIGLDRKLALEGEIDITPAAITKATQGKLVLKKPIPLRLKLTGDGTTNQVELLELAESALALSSGVEHAIERAALGKH